MSVLQQAKLHRTSLIIHIEKKQQELHRVEEFIENYHKFSGKTPTRAKNIKKEEIAVIVMQIMKEAGKPIKLSDLINLLMGRGIQINGKVPKAVLNNMLYRMKDKFVSLPDGYWVKNDLKAVS